MLLLLPPASVVNRLQPLPPHHPPHDHQQSAALLPLTSLQALPPSAPPPGNTPPVLRQSRLRRTLHEAGAPRQSAGRAAARRLEPLEGTDATLGALFPAQLVATWARGVVNSLSRAIL